MSRIDMDRMKDQQTRDLTPQEEAIMRKLAPVRALLDSPFQSAALLEDGCLIICKTDNYTPVLDSWIAPIGDNGPKARAIGVLNNAGNGYLRTKTDDARELDGDAARLHHLWSVDLQPSSPGPRTADLIRKEITALEAELHILSGEGFCTWDGMHGDLADIPPGGALLCARWAIEDRSYDVWYSTTEAAKAALLALAREHGAVPDQDGFHVDLTSPGCHTSRAWVQRNE